MRLVLLIIASNLFHALLAANLVLENRNIKAPLCDEVPGLVSASIIASNSHAAFPILHQLSWTWPAPGVGVIAIVESSNTSISPALSKYLSCKLILKDVVELTRLAPTPHSLVNQPPHFDNYDPQLGAQNYFGALARRQTPCADCTAYVGFFPAQQLLGNATAQAPSSTLAALRTFLQSMLDMSMVPGEVIAVEVIFDESADVIHAKQITNTSHADLACAGLKPGSDGLSVWSVEENTAATLASVCKDQQWVPADTASTQHGSTPAVASATHRFFVKREAQGSGMHRELTTELQGFGLASTPVDRCDVVLLEQLPAEIFVETHALEDRARRGLGPRIATFTDVEIERPAEVSRQTPLLVYLSDVDVSESFTVKLPIHLRYQAPSYDISQRPVFVVPPRVFTRCPSFANATGSETASGWRHTASMPGDLAPRVLKLTVPVGDLNDFPWVRYVTIFATTAGTVVLVYVALRKSRELQDDQHRD